MSKKMVLPWLASLSCLLVLLSSARSSVSLEGRRSQEEFNWLLHMPRLKNAAKVSDKRVVILFTRVVCVCLCPVIIDTVRYSIYAITVISLQSPVLYTTTIQVYQ